MGNFFLGIKALFRTWGNARFADDVRDLIEGKLVPDEDEPAAAPSAAAASVEPPPRERITQRNDALSLLSILQREARFLDFLKESVDAYSDEEVGAACRALHRECAATVERLFALRALNDKGEGEPIEVPGGFDPARFRFVGDHIPMRPPFAGKVSHPGWVATRCEVPIWKGPAESAMVVTPTEVEF